jgi:hypothetical protein
MDYKTSSKVSLSRAVTPQNDAIPVVSNVRILGVQFSSDMKWSNHVSNIVQLAHSKLGFLRILARSGCATEWLWKFYFAFIRSTLTYAFPSWCGIPDKLVKRLQRIEHRAGRLIGSQPSISLQVFLQNLCLRLARTIVSTPLHPLGEVFSKKPMRRALLRDSRLFAPHIARTSRFKTSFTKFSAHI